MKLANGDMWSVYNSCDLFLITTNSSIKNDGGLVMGAGIAKQARDRYKGLDLALGQRIEHMSIYGLLVSERFPQGKLGAFQVKTHFKDKAKLAIIDFAITKLLEFNFIFPNLDIHLNYPGIGNGKLTESDVYPIIKELPDNVTVWKFSNDPFQFGVYDDLVQEAEEDWTDGNPMDYGDR